MFAYLAVVFTTIVAQHVEAIGGSARIDALHSFGIHLRYTEGSHSSDHGYMAFQRPFYRVVGNPADPITVDTIREGYDGSAWEFYADPGIVLRTIGAAARATRHGAQQFIDPLVNYQARGVRLELTGTRMLGASNEFVLHATLRDGFQTNILVNTRTYLIDASEAVVPMHAFGRKLHTINIFRDYRPVGGVLYPFMTSEVDESTGKTLDSSRVLSVESNHVYPSAYFSPPTWNRTPLQQLIQRVYDERDQATAVMETYYDFMPVVDVHGKTAADAIDFVGYQCLKMGHPDSAIALLRANAIANPSYAPAYFGLGRALAAGGKRNEAVADFRRALALDPSYQRAKDALDALTDRS